MIEGVIITPLRQIEDDRGKVMHMLREDSPVYERDLEKYIFLLQIQIQLKPGICIKK